jgi:hypothetical protein
MLIPKLNIHSKQKEEMHGSLNQEKIQIEVMV